MKLNTLQRTNVALLFALSIAAGCSDQEPIPVTADWAITAEAFVGGRVVSADGGALDSVIVGVNVQDASALYYTELDTTNSDGRFVIRIQRAGTSTQFPFTTPATVNIGVLKGHAGPSGGPRPTQSSSVVLDFKPRGAAYDPQNFDIMIRGSLD